MIKIITTATKRGGPCGEEGASQSVLAKDNKTTESLWVKAQVMQPVLTSPRGACWKHWGKE